MSGYLHARDIEYLKRQLLACETAEQAERVKAGLALFGFVGDVQVTVPPDGKPIIICFDRLTDELTCNDPAFIGAGAG